jgi:hypothetical protein
VIPTASVPAENAPPVPSLPVGCSTVVTARVDTGRGSPIARALLSFMSARIPGAPPDGMPSAIDVARVTRLTLCRTGTGRPTSIVFLAGDFRADDLDRIASHAATKTDDPTKPRMQVSFSRGEIVLASDAAILSKAKRGPHGAYDIDPDAMVSVAMDRAAADAAIGGARAVRPAALADVEGLVVSLGLDGRTIDARAVMRTAKDASALAAALNEVFSQVASDGRMAFWKTLGLKAGADGSYVLVHGQLPAGTIESLLASAMSGIRRWHEVGQLAAKARAQRG